MHVPSDGDGAAVMVWGGVTRSLGRFGRRDGDTGTTGRNGHVLTLMRGAARDRNVPIAHLKENWFLGARWSSAVKGGQSFLKRRRGGFASTERLVILALRPLDGFQPSLLMLKA